VKTRSRRSEYPSAPGERPHFQVFVNGHVTEKLAAFRDENEAARRLGVRRQTRHVLACFGKTT